MGFYIQFDFFSHHAEKTFLNVNYIVRKLKYFKDLVATKASVALYSINFPTPQNRRLKLGFDKT